MTPSQMKSSCPGCWETFIKQHKGNSTHLLENDMYSLGADSFKAFCKSRTITGIIQRGHTAEKQVFLMNLHCICENRGRHHRTISVTINAKMKQLQLQNVFFDVAVALLPLSCLCEDTYNIDQTALKHASKMATKSWFSYLEAFCFWFFRNNLNIKISYKFGNLFHFEAQKALFLYSSGFRSFSTIALQRQVKSFCTR